MNTKLHLHRNSRLGQLSVLLILLLSLLPLVSAPASAAEISLPVDSLPAALMAAPGQQSADSVFVRDTMLPSGHHAAVVSSTPQQYRDESGRWQSINPRFMIQQGGFVNTTNVLQLRAEANKPELWMRVGTSVIGWETMALSTPTLTGTLPLARPLPLDIAAPAQLDAQGTTLSYAKSWSLPQLKEQITSAAGQVKQQLVLNLPVKANGADLLVEAILTLPANHTLLADGHMQSGSFTTKGAIQIRDSHNAVVLVLEAPVSYEQRRPDQRIAASYQLTPLTATIWRVGVRTPGAWLTDPQRLYPVVLDPAMAVLRATEGATIGRAECKAADYGGEIVVSETRDGTAPCRGLVRFDTAILPKLPPGATIQEAHLLMAASSSQEFLIQSMAAKGYVPTDPTGVFMDITAWQATSAWTMDGAGNVPTTAQPDIGVSYGSDIVYRRQGANIFHLDWTVQKGDQGIVSSWLSAPATNYGIELRSDEQQPQDTDKIIARWGAGFPSSTSWDESELARLAALYDPSDKHIKGSGVMLLVVYTGAQLNNNQQIDSTMFPGTLDGIFQPYHAYTVPASSSPWTAVAVKGLRDSNANGRFPIQRCVPKQAQTLEDTCDPAASAYPSNVIMIRNGSPDTPDTVAVNKLIDGDPAYYRIQSSESVQLPALPGSYGAGTGTLSYPYTGSRPQIVQAFHMNLETGLHFRIKALSPQNRVFAIPPAAPGTPITRDSRALGADEAVVSVGNRSGTWAIVVVNDTTQNDEQIGVEVNMGLSISVCPADAMPMRDGTCQFIVWPTATTPSVTAGSVTLYSEAGFTGTCPSSCTANLSKNNKQYALFLGYGAQRERLIGVFNSALDIVNSAFQSDPFAYQTIPEYMLMKQAAGSNPPAPDLDAMTWLWRSGLNVNTSTALLATPTSFTLIDAPLLPSDQTGNNLVGSVDLNSQRAQIQSDLHRTVAGSALSYRLSYSMSAEGYRTDLSDTTKNTSWSVTKTSGSDRIDNILSMRLKFGGSWNMALVMASADRKPLFSYLYTPALIAQSNELGGAASSVIAVIAPNSAMPEVLDSSGSPLALDTKTICAGSCLDLRNPGDIKNKTWELPDISTGSAVPSMQGAGDSLIPFNFRTFGGAVQVSSTVCPNSGNPAIVQVVKGETELALPMLGGNVDASFLLCAGSLREMEMSLSLGENVGIPIPPTPIFINGLHAKISTIGSSTYEVTVGLDYFISSSSFLHSLPGKTNLTFNTDGMIKGGTEGEILSGLMGYGAGFMVAWNPLDISLNGELRLPAASQGEWWIRAQLGVHVWKGQGWQHKYSWLPDDDTTHFTAYGTLTLRIPTGALLEQDLLLFTLYIPPSTITIADLSGKAGEFCRNSSCTSYEYGAEAAFAFDVGPLGTLRIGVYYGKESGLDFIFGSGGKTLIDQHGSGTQSAAAVTADYRVLQVGMCQYPMRHFFMGFVVHALFGPPGFPQDSRPTVPRQGYRYGQDRDAGRWSTQKRCPRWSKQGVGVG